MLKKEDVRVYVCACEAVKWGIMTGSPLTLLMRTLALGTHTHIHRIHRIHACTRPPHFPCWCLLFWRTQGLRCICLSYRDYAGSDPARPADFFEDADQVRVRGGVCG